jgi:hypothetical protein
VGSSPTSGTKQITLFFWSHPEAAFFCAVIFTARLQRTSDFVISVAANWLPKSTSGLFYLQSRVAICRRRTAGTLRSNRPDFEMWFSGALR